MGAAVSSYQDDEDNKASSKVQKTADFIDFILFYTATAHRELNESGGEYCVVCKNVYVCMFDIESCGSGDPFINSFLHSFIYLLSRINLH